MADSAERAKPGVTRGRDAGATMVEILLAIVLLGTVVTTLLAAVQAGVTTSARNRQAAAIETMVVNIADRINRAPADKCNYAPYAQFAADTYDWDGTVDVDQYYYEPPPATPSGAAQLQLAGSWQGDGSSACKEDARRENEASRIVVTIRAAGSNTWRTIEVVKSNV